MQMNGNGGVEHHFEFADGDVWVTVPAQDPDGTLDIQLIHGPVPVTPETPVTPTVFEPSDIRINFQVSKDGSPVQKFNPPMVLRVKITPKALDDKKIPGQLRLAFWDGSAWVLFTKQKHLFQLTPHYGIAVIRDWGDPMVAWG